jgi:hypothetical protein
MDFIPKPVLTIDIVNYSLMSNTDQYQSFRTLIELLSQAIPREHNQRARRIWSPAGDGGSLTFWDDITAALQTAVALGRLFKDRNQYLPEDRQIRLRIGLHSGTVIKEVDFDERENVWGSGINISARVMSMAKPGQILASKEFCTQADLLSRPKEVTYIGKWWAKHNKAIDLYNIYIEGAGLPPSEVDEWYGPFHYPLQQAMETYRAMIEDEKATGPAFRVAVLCKRLLDLEPSNTSAQRVLESISESRFNRSAGARNLYDSFFSRLSPSALIYFFQNSQFRAFPKDTTIAKEGDPANNMMMVVSGEIVPSIQGNRLKDQRDDTEVVLREGAIIGEMGLFSPGGTRTATLQASKNTITLTLDYKYLRTLENAPNAKENRERVEIQKRIWKNYCERTAANAVNLNPLFQTLEPDQRSRLIDFDNYEFLPAEHGQALHLSVEDAWEYLTIIVGGGLTVHTKKDQAAFECKPDETLGLLRLVISEDAECPFSEIEALPETYLLRFPYNVIRDLVGDAKNSLFLDDCVKYGGREKRRFKLM